MHLKFTVWMALGLAIIVTLILTVTTPLGIGYDTTRIFGAMLRAGGTSQFELGGWLLAVLFWWAAIYAIGRFVQARH